MLQILRQFARLTGAGGKFCKGCARERSRAGREAALLSEAQAYEEKRIINDETRGAHKRQKIMPPWNKKDVTLSLR